MEARDDGDGTYALRWCAEVAGEYELHIAREHAPISGSPYRCYVASGFARPPSDADALKAALRVLHVAGNALEELPSLPPGLRDLDLSRNLLTRVSLLHYTSVILLENLQRKEA